MISKHTVLVLLHQYLMDGLRVLLWTTVSSLSQNINKIEKDDLYMEDFECICHLCCLNCFSFLLILYRENF